MEGYQQMYLPEDGIAMFRGFFKELLDADGGAVLWHCVSGKDRTGNATMLLLTVLGVDKETIIEDFLLTNLRLSEGFALSRFKDRFGEDFIAGRKDAVEGLVNRGLLIADKENVRTTPRGMDLLDTVLLALFPSN